MTTTPNMNLDLPTPEITLGPEWAEQIVAALERVDAHDHTSGEGVQVKSAGILIDALLSFNSQALTTLLYTQLINNVGLNNVNGSVQWVGGDLYVVNHNGSAIQITNGNLINAPGSGQIVAKIVTPPYTATASDAQRILICDGPGKITLPTAGAGGGIWLGVKDGTGNAQNANIEIEVSITGTERIDLDDTLVVIDSNKGSLDLVADGASNWYLV